MAKLIFNTENSKMKIETNSNEGFKTGLRSERDLLKKRSAKYVRFFSALDQKSLTSVEGWKELMDIVNEEFGTAELASLPLGIVARCYLGENYEVHILDLSGSNIIKHFRDSEVMPPDFEKARGLALHNIYCFVEVYTDKLILIREDFQPVTYGNNI